MHFILVLISALFIGCRPSPFVVKELSVQSPRTLKSLPTNDDTIDPSKKMLLKKRYEQVKKPSFALVNAYYRLPQHKPYGALSLKTSYSYMGVIEELKIEHPSNDYVISPIEGDDALSLNNAFATLLDMGVHIKELSLSDATTLAKAEQEAAKEGKIFALSYRLLPKVDYLMTLNKTTSQRGPVLVGRVLSKDGRLMAFKVVYQPQHGQDLSALILNLFEDTINRI